MEVIKRKRAQLTLLLSLGVWVLELVAAAAAAAAAAAVSACVRSWWYSATLVVVGGGELGKQFTVVVGVGEEEKEGTGS